MEVILVEIYRHADKFRTLVNIKGYSLKEAIDHVRHVYDYEILVLSAKYADPEKLINSL